MIDDRDHRLRRVETFVLIPIGGVVGANARYVLGFVSSGPSGYLRRERDRQSGFITPFYEAAYARLLAAETRLVLATNLLSSYTTYSTFALEIVQASPLVGLGNVAANYAAGFAAAYARSRLGAFLEGR
jgi:CrcB protein